MVSRDAGSQNMAINAIDSGFDSFEEIKCLIFSFLCCSAKVEALH